MTETQTAEQRAEEIGKEHGENAAAWWENPAAGPLGATRILKGLEDGDPAIYDQLPYPDLSGEWADGYTPRRLAEDCGMPEDSDASDDLCNIYDAAFQEACEAAIVRYCQGIVETA